VLALSAAGVGLWLATNEPPFPAAVADAQANAPGQSPFLQISAPEPEAALAPGSTQQRPSSARSASAANIRAAVEREIAAAGLSNTVSVKDRERIAAALSDLGTAARRVDRRGRSVERDAAANTAVVDDREQPVERAPRP
jgi:hypothetical protein